MTGTCQIHTATPCGFFHVRLRRGRTCIRPSRPPSFLCISSSPSPTGPGGTRAEGQGIPRVIEKWGKSMKIMICLGMFGMCWYFHDNPHENDSGLLWWGKVASTRRGPAFCSSIPSILWVWVNTKNDIPSVHSPWLPVQPPLLLLTSPVLLVNPLSLLVNLSCVLANPHCCWLKPPFALLKTTIFCWLKPLFSLVKQDVSTTTEPWLHFLILRTYVLFVSIFMRSLNLHIQLLLFPKPCGPKARTCGYGELSRQRDWPDQWALEMIPLGCGDETTTDGEIFQRV